MKKHFLLLPLIILLAGCPGRDGLNLSERRAIYIDGDRVCFTVNKQDVLTRYLFSTNGREYNVLFNANQVHLSYPDTCFTVQLDYGVRYGASYAMNGKNYTWTFILDREGQTIGLGNN